MVPDALGEIADAVRERQRLLEVLEGVLLLEVMVIDHVPLAAEIGQEGLDLAVVERRHAAFAWHALHRREVASHHAALAAASRSATISSAAAPVEIPPASPRANTSASVSPICRRRSATRSSSSSSISYDTRWITPPAFTT